MNHAAATASWPCDRAIRCVFIRVSMPEHRPMRGAFRASWRGPVRSAFGRYARTTARRFTDWFFGLCKRAATGAQGHMSSTSSGHRPPTYRTQISPDQRHGKAQGWPYQGGPANPSFPIEHGIGDHAPPPMSSFAIGSSPIGPGTQNAITDAAEPVPSSVGIVPQTTLSPSGKGHLCYIEQA